VQVVVEKQSVVINQLGDLTTQAVGRESVACRGKTAGCLGRFSHQKKLQSALHRERAKQR